MVNGAAPTNGHLVRYAEEKGGSYAQRMRAAAARAVGDSMRILRVAGKLSDELDDATPVHGVPVTELHEEDSLVMAVQAVVGDGRRG